MSEFEQIHRNIGIPRWATPWAASWVALAADAGLSRGSETFAAPRLESAQQHDPAPCIAASKTATPKINFARVRGDASGIHVTTRVRPEALGPLSVHPLALQVTLLSALGLVAIAMLIVMPLVGGG